MNSVACLSFLAAIPLLSLNPTGVVAPAPHGGGCLFPPVAPPTPPRQPPPDWGGPSDGTPEDTPPSSGPSTPGPGGPSSPTGPASPGGSVPSSPGTVGGPTTGAPIGIDYTTWNYWWEFNRHRFLGLREAVHSSLPTTGGDDFYMGATVRSEDAARSSLRPTLRDLRERVLPALLRELERPDQNDITTSALLALAKLRIHDVDVRAHLTSRLQSPLRVVRECAALALGISRDPGAVPDLSALVADTRRGRELCGNTRVDRRTRAFAAYALGLIAKTSNSVDVKASVFESLRPLLGRENSSWDIKVAAIESIRLITPDLERTYKGWKLRDRAVESLLACYIDDSGRGEEVVQAHVPAAIAKLLGRGGDKPRRCIDLFLADLSEKKRSPWIRQSAMIALGQLCTPDDDVTCRAIVRYYEHGKDQQARFFGLIALGQIGGAKNRDRLLHIFGRGTKNIVKPWAALALGVLGYHARRSAADPVVDVLVGDAIFDAWLNGKNASTRGALAIAMGLCGYSPAQDQLLEQLNKNDHRAELAGYLSTSLALLECHTAVPTVRRIAMSSRHRPNLLVKTCTALALLDDKSIAPRLLEALDQKKPNVTELAATANAIGQVGDRESLGKILAVITDPSLTRLGRGAAISGLGCVIDREVMPWQAAISSNLNYRAGVETLSDGARGILDIL